MPDNVVRDVLAGAIRPDGERVSEADQVGTCKRSISGRTFALNRVFYPQQKPAILLNANGCYARQVLS